MSMAANPVRLDFRRLEDYATHRRDAAFLRKVTSVNRIEAAAYESYRAYCGILGSVPMALDAWQSHSRRLFGNSSASNRVASVNEVIL